ncbi:sulfite exporter TauE/SafE family protein [Paenibacillus aurantius]|uniref:Probable membrane transporter protein n=1 Tax=Paenibacillus aurantius TaxID=2918900 RepID=A0AA96LBG8_9BACL|nr:sulfite exporter TauE/SafE family protein [Paenibacillus aurantius]WNQ10170.1 sulfite exporter TauE/SafE family protein [Paenibacillus aurantius]
MEIHIVLIGLLVGLLVGLTGVGGASLLTPILILANVNPTIAVGTDLFYNSITKLFGTYQHFKQKSVNLQLVKYLAMGSIPGAVIAITLLKVFESFYHNQESIIKHALGVVLIIVALATIFRQLFQHKIKESSIQTKPIEEKKLLTILTGALLGFIVGLTSIGSGSLFAILMIYFFRMTAAEVVGTDIAHAFLLVTVAGLLHAGLGHVDYGLAINLLVGSIPGVLAGSYFSAKVPPRPLRTIMAGLIFISGLKLI